MGALRDRLIRDMQLRRFSASTQRSYVSAVVGLTKHYRIAPDQLDRPRIQDYVLFLTNQRKLHWSTVNVIVSGLNFFFGHTLQRRDLVPIVPPRKNRRQLPDILSAEELLRLFASADNLYDRVLLMTSYGGGLRVGEVGRLRVADIDSQRMTIRVVQGKGNKDRYTLLSAQLLSELRRYWKQCRPSPWLFPGRRRGQPANPKKVQRIFRRCKQRAGISKRGSVHMLRHSFASHLLEAGVDIRIIQIVMGHASIRTTVRYLQVTRKTWENTKSPLDFIDLSQLPPLQEVPPCQPS
jgi:integrase/recombinase XerD